MRNEKRITDAQLSQATQNDRADAKEHRRQTWRSLKTLLGWVALVSVAGSAIYDLTGRLFHVGR